MKTIVGDADLDTKSASELPAFAIRGMCRGINTDVPNNAKDTQAADHLIASKAAARIASISRARKITLDDL